MNVNVISPQVVVNETDNTLYNAAGVAGPSGAIVLRNAYKGRENDTVLVADEVNLVNTFGMPTNFEDCYEDMFSAIKFLEQSQYLYCTRVMPATATFAGTMATSGASASFAANTVGTAYSLGSGVGEIADPDFFADEVSVSNPYVMEFIAAYRGYSGNNIRVAVCDKTSYDAIKLKQNGSWNTYAAFYSIDTSLNSTKEFLVVIQECTQGTDPSVESNWKFAEYFSVSTDPGAVDSLGQQKFVESRVNNNSNCIRVALNPNYQNVSVVPFATSTWQVLGGGANTTANGMDPNDDESIGDPIITAALNLYANAENTTVSTLIDSNKSNNMKVLMAQIATSRKDCTLILDCPKAVVVNNAGNEEDDLVTWINTDMYGISSSISTSYAATYGNWLNIYDKYNNKYRWIPAAGAVAGVYAFCEGSVNPWASPAGLNRAVLNGIRSLAWNPTLTQRDGIYKFNINPIVAFAGVGKVIWGQKTLLDVDSAFNRVETRKLFNYLEKSSVSIAKYYMFEPNTTSNRSKFVTQLKPIYDDAKGRGGIDNYLIVCDQTNNTPDTVSQGILSANIFVKPTFAAEYIMLNFIATAASVTFTENISVS